MGNENSSPVVRTVNLTKVFPQSSVRALDDINLAVTGGEFVCIKGPSGSGKSTLLNTLAGLIDPTDGEVWIQGRRLQDIRNKALFRRQSIGFIFQDFYLYPDFTVLENVLLPFIRSFAFDRKLSDKARRILTDIGMGGKLRQNVNTLSTGERQRTCIARAILHDPALILADEPTGNLDSKNAVLTLEILKKINTEHQATILMVTHDEQVMHYAGRVISIVDGKTTADSV